MEATLLTGFVDLGMSAILFEILVLPFERSWGNLNSATVKDV